jgi:hypothetical protein
MPSLTFRSPLPWYARRLRILFLWAIMLMILGASALPTYAKDKGGGHLPPVNNFATARFKLLTTVETTNQKSIVFGGGAVVLPDRTSTWIGSDESKDLIDIVQIGSTTYQRVGGGPWQRRDDASVGMQAQPVSAQFNVLQANANAILELGNEMVGDVPTAHYQVWLRGDKALALNGNMGEALPKDLRDLLKQTAFKFDLWVGTQDGFLHQQRIELMIPATKINRIPVPATRISSLVTFFDINDPLISVNAPI